MVVVVGGGGGGGGGGGMGTGGGGPGHCCSYSIPNPAPTVSFGVCNYVRFFCYCCTFTCVGAEKVRSFRALSITFGRGFQKFGFEKCCFHPGHIINLIIYYLSMYVFLYGNNFIPLSYKRKNRNLEEIT